MGQTLLHIYHWSSTKSSEKCELLRQDLVHWLIASGPFYFSYLLFWFLIFCSLYSHLRNLYRDQTSWRSDRSALFFCHDFAMILPSAFPSGLFSVLFGHGFWWELGIYQTRYHSVQEFFLLIFAADVGVVFFFFFPCEILQIWYHECKNWFLFIC